MLDAETRGEIIRLYWSGIGARRISEKNGWPESQVYQVLIEAGGELTRHSRNPVTEDRLAYAEQLFKDGASREEVSRTAGIGLRALKSWFPEYRWTFQEAGVYAWMTQKYNRMIAKEWKV